PARGTPSPATPGLSPTLLVSTRASTPALHDALPISMYWAAGIAAFKAGPLTAPSDDFSISASPASLSLSAGQGGTTTISTAVTSGSAQTVSLSLSGLPAGATGSFNPSAVTAGGSSTLSISTASSTPGGSYTLTVTGTGTTATHTTTVGLTVS